MNTIYHNPRCSKSRQTLEILENKELNFTIVKYLDTPLSKQELAQLCTQLALAPSECIRTGESLYKELGLKTASEEELLEAMAAHPILVERPIVVTEKGARIGRPPENVLDIL